MENVHMFMDPLCLITCLEANSDDKMHQRTLMIDTDQKSDEEKNQCRNEEHLVPSKRRLVLVKTHCLPIVIVDREDEIAFDIWFIPIIFHC